MMELEIVSAINRQFPGGTMPATVGAPSARILVKKIKIRRCKSSPTTKAKKRVVLVFYPPRLEPLPAPKSTFGLVNGMKQFDQLDAQVLGLSVDSAWSHKAYAEENGHPLSAALPTSTLAGASRRTSTGVYLADQRHHRPAPSPIIDRDGKLAWHKKLRYPRRPRY